jgi:hypothetical protein
MGFYNSKAQVFWKLREIVEVLRERQLKEFDANIGVSGKRGDGKSTLLFQIFRRFKKYGFHQEKHQVYNRDDVLNLLKHQEFSFCWDDEGINTGYKRDFQNTEQKSLIKVVTAYRDNYNIYGTAIPFFYTLDKGLRELMFMHIHIIERGLAVIFLPLEDQIHTQDPWDTYNNAKLEMLWQKRLQADPNFKFPYHKLSTFAGYITFRDMSDKQKARYKKIKKAKRQESFLTEKEKVAEKNEGIVVQVYDLLKEGKITTEGLNQICVLNALDVTTLKRKINSKLAKAGDPLRIVDYLKKNDPEPIVRFTDEQKKIREMVGGF